MSRRARRSRRRQAAQICPNSEVTDVAIYIRLSKETEATTSPARQRQICTTEARSRYGPDVRLHFYEDIDESGYSQRWEDRPELTRMLDELHKVQRVMVWRLDRLSREGIVAVHRIMEVLTEQEVGFDSATEPGLSTSTAMGKMMLSILALFAEMESENISIRTLGAHAYLRDVGRWRGGKVPFGYRLIPNPDGPGRILAVDDADAAVVREMYARLLSGDTLTDLRAWLNDEYPSTGSWDHATLRRKLLSPTNRGYQVHEGEIHRHSETGDLVTIAPPLIDNDTFLRAERQLTEHQHKRGRRKRTDDLLLPGMAQCDVCGGTMYPAGTALRSYICVGKRTGQCIGNTASQTRVDQAVYDVVLNRIDDWLREGLEDEAQRRAEAQPDVQAELDRMGDLVTVMQRELTEARETFGPHDPYSQQLATDLRAKNEARVTLRRQLEAAAPNAGATALKNKLGDRPAEAFAAATIHDQQDVVQDMLQPVVIRKAARRGAPWDPGRLSIALR